jgi:hypothetical protein
MSERPGLVFVASGDGGDFLNTWERLRRAIWSARKVCAWPHDIVVLDVGLNDLQRDALRAENICVFCCEPWNQPILATKWMFKIWADRWVMNDPVIVADADLEFRDERVLDELLDICRQGRFFIVEERARWNAAMAPFAELDRAGREAALYAVETFGPMLRRPVLNAGLFGGPRPLFDDVLDLCRAIAPSLQVVYRWFWEQLALSYWCRHKLLAERVEILPTEYNWLTAHGVNPQARVLHHHADIGNDVRAEFPDDFMPAKLHRAPRPAAKVLWVPANANTGAEIAPCTGPSTEN